MPGIRVFNRVSVPSSRLVKASDLEESHLLTTIIACSASAANLRLSRSPGTIVQSEILIVLCFCEIFRIHVQKVDSPDFSDAIW